ncbi:MAG: ATP-binding protein [Kiritimatiellae bacterium]|nr:ATP-binding protein [Kiritimatiellia bacterium]
MKEQLLMRLLRRPNRSFFLFGPRGSGKSTWIKQTFSDAAVFDLLDSSLLLELTREPHVLEALVGERPPDSWVVLDEVQKVPPLLDEAHRLMESRQWQFVLCGSSARKLKRGGADLLGGRALTLNMEPFSSAEMGDRFDLDHSLEWGMLPMVQFDRANGADILAAYVDTYIKEEIRAEGAIRRLAPFVRFLGIAGQVNGQPLNALNIAREAAVPRTTVDGYFAVLAETLLAHFLPAYRPGLKVREAAHPKFFWVDPGIARAAAGLLRDPADRLWKGTALETLIFHELRVYNTTSGKHRDLAYYATPSGTEIDFIIETRKHLAGSPPSVVGLEVKLAPRWNRKWERAMRELHAQPGIRVERMIGIYTGERAYHYDGLDVWPVARFFKELHHGNVF